MPAEDVQQRNGGYYVKGTRVSLDSIVYSYKGGESPESIRQNFPSLRLEQVDGAIAFYLAHQADVDANIREGEEELERSVPPLSQSRPDLHARLQRLVRNWPSRSEHSISGNISRGSLSMQP